MQRMIYRRPNHAAAMATLLIGAIACFTLSGCNSLYSEGAVAGAGITGAAIAGSVTRNAAVATGIGLGAVSFILSVLCHHDNWRCISCLCGEKQV